MILLISICSSVFLCYFLYEFFGLEIGMTVISGVIVGCLLRVVYLVRDIRTLLEGSNIGKEWTKNFLSEEKKRKVQVNKTSIK